MTARQLLLVPIELSSWRRGLTPSDGVAEFLALNQGVVARLGLEVSMIDCHTMSTMELSPESRLSLHQRGEEEAQRFKWIESEKAGRDLGETAIRSWIGQHWNGFLRHRWLEHLQGKAFWIELDQGDFGLLQRAFRGSPLIDPILEHFKQGRENLDIILWAMKLNHPMDEVLEILEALDVNSRGSSADSTRVASGARSDAVGPPSVRLEPDSV